jgi:hypothetical protein
MIIDQFREIILGMKADTGTDIGVDIYFTGFILRL